MDCLEERRWAIIIGCIVLIIVVGVLLYFLISLAFVYNPIDSYPEDGLWFCEETGLCLSFEAAEMSYLLNNGGRTLCETTHSPGTSRISVYLAIDPIYCEGEWLYYEGDKVCDLFFIKLTKNRLILKDDAGKQYTFVRIPEA